MSDHAPPDEVPISAELVQTLVAEQHPDLAHLPVGRRHEGWDMAMFPLGDGLALRLPRRAVAVSSLEAEIRWVRLLSPGWTFPTQRIERVGDPGAGYPWPWAVVTWLPGQVAASHPLDASAGPALGRALTEVHVPAHPEAPFNDEQSVSLAEREPTLLTRLDEVAAAAPGRGQRLDRERADQIWHAAVTAPVDLPRSWIHADAHPFNLVSQGGAFAGIIDWADIAAGDPATDLGFLWLDLPAAGVAAALDAYGAGSHWAEGTPRGASPATRARAHGTGLALAVDFATWDTPATSSIGWRALGELGVAVPDGHRRD